MVGNHLSSHGFAAGKGPTAARTVVGSSGAGQRFRVGDVASAAARFNDDQFPDSPYNAFDSDKFNTASEKAPKARTAAEQSLIEIRDKIMLREIYRSPVKQFEEDQTAPNSFQYVGSGVKVGEAERIVGWYKLRNSTKYRAFYGDLSVKEVAAAELPLNIAN